MGELLLFPSSDRACRPVATASGAEAASAVRPTDQRWHILDQVDLPAEPLVNGQPQRGIIERMMIDGTAGMFWIRLTGGPRGGSILVVEGHRLARPARAGISPLSHG